MKEGQILQKAIQKAAKNGYKPPMVPVVSAHSMGGLRTIWKYYLQQMVLEKKPIRYLEKFL